MSRTPAQAVSHPNSLALALFFTAILHQYRREVPAVREQAAATVTLAAKQGVVLWLDWGTVLHGWVQAMQGQVEAGIAEIRQGMAADLDKGGRLMQPYFLGLLAEVYGKSGRPIKRGCLS
jgi:adenylate cyclase